ncbi:hypothetical protein GALMADRAFT_95055 [Galerina marginata CBS 339.88]|uniref:PAN2-PAN3 deadenylation complex subunit PAN3 n=1 Tax=Galerina marginata (strain CBS 339.88) TaxID=685588 RepID=A0A067T7M7_GALM3|nr:hypothetical protein GALMADRAFT_95055 [Galerina marginata CBS 339.88]
MAFFSRPQSTAVRIARPTTEDDSLRQPARKDSVQRQCRNVVIHGSCKFQDKGCSYYHPPAADAPQPPPSSSPVLRTASPAMGTLTPKAVNAPVFVPKFAAAAAAAAAAREAAPPPAPPPPSTETASTTTPSSSILSSEEERSAEQNGHEQPHDEYQGQYQEEQYQEGQYQEQYQDEQQDYAYQPEYENYDYQGEQAANDMQGLELGETNYYDTTNQADYRPNPYNHDVMEATYYHAPPVFVRQPLNYLLYTPYTPPELVKNTVNSHFVPASTDLRQLLQERSETVRDTAPTGLGLPEELQGYHTLVPLEPSVPPPERKKFGNWHSTVYRATRTSDGIPHVLRRIENFRLTQQAAFAPIEIWSQIQHPSIVPVREAFTTRSFNDNSLVVSYAYYPNAKTLYDAHMKPKPPPTYQQTVYYGRHHHQQQQQQQQTVAERTLWSYIVQIASAIKKVHERGQAVRMIDVTKVLVTGQNRVRISSCGIFDVLLYGTQQQDISFFQQEDLLKFGRLIFALCTNNLAAANQTNLTKSVDIMKKVYSMDLQAFALYLCSKIPKTIDQVLEMLRPRILQEHDEALMATDRLEYELLGELENARLFRLMCKFGFINERPEFARDARWSETGDRYIIKLFRDYAFHQVDEHGNPVLDLTHVLTCLNKLDAGTDEQLMLVSRDEQSCLVVSYKDIKQCIANAFEDLVKATTASQSGKEAKVI